MKKVLALVLTGVMVLGLTACGSSQSSSEAPAPAESTAESSVESEAPAEESSEPVALTYWYWADSPEDSACIQDIVKAYNESNGKGITVTAEEFPWNSGGFMEDTFTTIMGGGGPDISNFKASSGSLYVANGLLADMTSYVDSWADKGQISDAAWDVMRSATNTETINILPWTLEPLYVYYRPSIFAAAGVKVPTTIEEFLDVCEKCTMDTDGDGTVDVYGFGMRGAGGGQEHLGNFL